MRTPEPKRSRTKPEKEKTDTTRRKWRNWGKREKRAREHDTKAATKKRAFKGMKKK